MSGLVEIAYAYPSASVLDRSASDGRAALTLATSGGNAGDAALFVGTAREADVVADGLLAIAAVARSRFHVPAAMLARLILAADPIVTVADDRLRFESLSACAGVYARLDLLGEAVDGSVIGRGTTNVDLGPELRAALATVDDREPLGLMIGTDSVTVRSGGALVEERRVPLPSRWIRSLTEVATIAPTLEPVAVLEHGPALHLLREAMRLPVNRAAWVVAGGRAARIAHHAATGSVAATGLGRLRPTERFLRHLHRLTLYAGRDGTTGWQIDVEDARLTVVLSPEAWRGFSGEGRTVEVLATARTGSAARLRAALRWRSAVGAEDLARKTGMDAEAVRAGLGLLATAGVVGYDQADGAYFHRELPFDLAAMDRRQPRLAGAESLVQQGRVRMAESGDAGVVAWVGGTGVEHRVSIAADGAAACTCPWFARHGGERGPCKHVLAVELHLVDT